jgi:hypothetical protein
MRHRYGAAQQIEDGECFYCDRKGGAPFLMTADDVLHCSRCFEDFTPDEFHAWLLDCPSIVKREESGSTWRTFHDDIRHLGAEPSLCGQLSVQEVA